MFLVLLTALFGPLALAQEQAPAAEVYSPLSRVFTSLPDPEHKVEAADLALAKGPASAELLLAAARSRDAILRFNEAIPLYTRGMDEYASDVRFPRYRGHRLISTRRFQLAIADLKLAADMAPASFDVSYHLGLAYYLHGDFNHAAREYARCLAMASHPKPDFMKGMPAGWRPCYAMDDDSRVAITDWAWRALRRAGKPEEAAKLLAPIREGMAVKENQSYYKALLLYKGLKPEADVMAPPLEGTAAATLGYADGLWHWLEGRKEQACAAWERAVSGDNWSAFGFIAAETELGRGVCPAGRKR